MDLFGVSFVDSDGRDLLVEMHRKGARLVGSGPMISSLIDEIEGVSEKPKVWMEKRIAYLLLLLGLLAAAGKLVGQEP